MVAARPEIAAGRQERPLMPMSGYRGRWELGKATG
jgi:hypothetical protein